MEQKFTNFANHVGTLYVPSDKKCPEEFRKSLENIINILRHTARKFKSAKNKLEAATGFIEVMKDSGMTPTAQDSLESLKKKANHKLINKLLQKTHPDKWKEKSKHLEERLTPFAKALNLMSECILIAC